MILRYWAARRVFEFGEIALRTGLEDLKKARKVDEN